jgi:hypothetical protein
LSIKTARLRADEYHVRVAKTLEEAKQLAEAGLNYFTVIEGA